MAKTFMRKFSQVLPLVGLAGLILLVVYGHQQGIFDSVASLQDFIKQFGEYAIVIFILLQLIQVIVPILPGGISTVVGMVLFGTFPGLIYSYIGLVLGEIAGFWLIRHYGIGFAQAILSAKKFDQFQQMMAGNQKNIKRILILTLLIPFAPDDLVCLASGLSNLPFREFLKIILLLKPWSITIYGLILMDLFKKAEGIL